jgi:hypothetical protein
MDVKPIRHGENANATLKRHGKESANIRNVGQTPTRATRRAANFPPASFSSRLRAD